MISSFEHHRLALAHHRPAGAPAGDDVHDGEGAGVVPAGRAAVVLDEVHLQRSWAILVPAVAIDLHLRLEDSARMRSRAHQPRFRPGQLRQATRQGRATDALKLLSSLAGKLDLRVSRQGRGERQQLWVRTLGATVVERLPRHLDDAQAVSVRARSAGALLRGTRPPREQLVHQRDRVLPVESRHPKEFVQQGALRLATPRRAVALAHRLYVLAPRDHRQSSRPRPRRHPPTYGSIYF